MDPSPLHSASPSDPKWLRSTFASIYKDRSELRTTLCAIQEWASLYSILNQVPKGDIRSLATVLNDCPQWARKKALKQLKSRSPGTYSKCIDAISEFQFSKDLFDPDNLFPHVATEPFVGNLREPMNRCQRCKTGFEEGDDIHWKHCKKHTLHYKCANSSQRSMELILASCNECFPSKIEFLPIEILENITARLPARDAGSVALASSRTSTVPKDRLNPVVYLSSTFSNPLSLIAEMADNGCVLSGSRALEFFVPCSTEEGSDWDFYVNGYTSCVVNMIRALEESGVEWDLLEDRTKEFLRGDEKSMKIKVGEVQNIESWAASDLIGTINIEDEVGRLLLSIWDAQLATFDRSQEITVLKRNGSYFRELPSESHNSTVEEDDPSIASAEGGFSVITGRVSTKHGSSKVQLIICHSYGIPLNCLQVLSRFHSTPVQCFLAGFGAGHMFYDLTSSKAGIVWNSCHKSLNRLRRKREAVEKYRRRGFELRNQGDIEWPPARMRLGHNGTFYMPFTELYRELEDFKKDMSSPCSRFGKKAHPVAHFLEGLNWGIRNTTWSLEENGPRHDVHPLLKRARKNPDEIPGIRDIVTKCPADILERCHEGGKCFSLSKYVDEHAPFGTPGVKKVEGVTKLSRMERKLVLSGSIGRLCGYSPVSHIL